jgi:hypothetical protein
MTHEHKPISVWLLSGLIFLLYGLIIAGHGIYTYYLGVETAQSIKSGYPAIWWGAIVLLLGIVLTIAGAYANRKDV